MIWRMTAWSVAVGVITLSAAELELTDATYKKWREFIDVKPAELRWQAIPWRQNFWAGVVDAQKQDRPLLLWLYGGDPLAVC